LKTPDPSECLLTETTDIPEAAAESKAKTMPIIEFHFHFTARTIKTNPSNLRFLQVN
jgi:hypothetical protein